MSSRSGALVLLLLHVAAGAVVQQPWSIEAEIKEWRKEGLPEVVSFGHIGDTSVQALLIAQPELGGIFGWGSTEKNVHYYLFTKNNPTEGKKFTRTKSEVTSAGFDSNRPTVMIVHGFGNTIKSDVFTTIIPNLLEAGDYNVIGVDWGALCGKPWYLEARNNVQPVGKEVAKTVDFLVNELGLRLKNLHLIGHSLGAHVVGNIGKFVTTGKVHRITGLDPAMPLFMLNAPDRMSKDDAEVVDAIHTCAGLLGVKLPHGDVDFYPNGGRDTQPGCFPDLGSCSHGRSYQYFAESILEPSAFQATLCPSSDEALDSDCSDNGQTARMGFHLSYKKSGSYYLSTASSAPYDVKEHDKKSS